MTRSELIKEIMRLREGIRLRRDSTGHDLCWHQVVSERLGHAHPGFTMATYQHLIPGMSSAAAQQFADLLAEAGR